MSYDFFPKGVGSKSADVGLNFAASWNTNGTPARKTEAEEAGDYLMQHFQSLMNKKGKSTNNKSLNESNCDKKLHNSLPPGPKQGNSFSSKNEKNLLLPPKYSMDADYDGYGNSRIRIIGKNNKTIFYYDNETYTQAGSQVSKTTYYDKNKNKTGSRITSYSNGGKKVNRNYYDKYGNHILNEKIEIDKNGNSTKVYTDENGNQITDEKEIQRRKSMVEPQDKDYKKYKKDEKEYFDTISKY